MIPPVQIRRRQDQGMGASQVILFPASPDNCLPPSTYPPAKGKQKRKRREGEEEKKEEH